MSMSSLCAAHITYENETLSFMQLDRFTDIIQLVFGKINAIYYISKIESNKKQTNKYAFCCVIDTRNR